MFNVRSVATARAVVAPVVSRRFIRRLSICLVLTVFDTRTLIAVGPSAYRFSHGKPLFTAIFAALAFALITSLAHMWFLTFRQRNVQ
jgi:hypothetical protein